MTLKQAFEMIKAKLNKMEAPSFTLEEFNIHWNDAVQQWYNKAYAEFNLNQQTTDNLQSMTQYIEIRIVGNIGTPFNYTGAVSDKYSTPTIPIINIPLGIRFLLPNNYRHLLNCLVEYTNTSNNQYCPYQPGDIFAFPAKRLSEDMEMRVYANFFMKPHYKSPYYQISDNPATNIHIPFNHNVTGINNAEIDILSGNHPKFKVSKVMMKYIKTPLYYTLTYTEANDDTLAGSATDTSQVIEFPDYVASEIVNQCVKIIMENTMNQRVQSYGPINDSIVPARPN